MKITANSLAKDFADIVGQEDAKLALKSALLAQRNIILVGPPGVGKTTLAKNVAKILGDVPFVRIQGSPDLTVEDMIGDIDPAKALELGPAAIEAFVPGKIFKADKGILFFDEVNRCTEKLQNALLQVLEERHVTVGTYTLDLAADFLFIGTMNPEDSSTEKLSDVFLDRFDLVDVTYPATIEEEEHIVNLRARKSTATFPQILRRGVISFVQQLRADPNLERKPSVRATLGIVDRAGAMAELRGGKEVSLEDVRAVLASVLQHRISLKPSMKYLESTDDYVRKAFNKFSATHSMGGEG